MRMTTGLAAAGALAVLLAAVPASSQESGYHDEMAAKIEAQREEIRRHTEAMEAIDDPEVLQLEMQRHFRMTEELLGWVVEHQKRRLADAGPDQASTAPTGGQVDPSATSMAPGMGMGGCKGEGCGKGMDTGGKGMEMSGKGMGGMGHGGGSMKGGKGEHGGGEHGGHGMGSMASSSEPPSVAGASAAAARIAEREALLREITTHSLYLEGVTDPEMRARETLKHQRMLDRLMGLMQE